MSCPICQSPGAAPHLTVRGYTLLACPRCEAWYLDEDQTDKGQYEGGYLKRGGPAAQRHSGYYDYESELRLHLRNFADNLDAVDRFAKGRRLLDVGCASGHFLLAARERGYEAQGVDVSEEGVAEARRRGLRAVAGDVRQLELGGPFDVITLWETVEHIQDPIPVLSHLRGRLAEGGILALCTGDAHSPLARALGKRWWYVTPPDHCVYYNPKALTVALSRAGFELLSLSHVARHWVSARNVVMKLMRSLDAAPRRSLAVAGRVPDLPLPVYHGTTLLAVARPR